MKRTLRAAQRSDRVWSSKGTKPTKPAAKTSVRNARPLSRVTKKVLVRKKSSPAKSGKKNQSFNVIGMLVSLSLVAIVAMIMTISAVWKWGSWPTYNRLLIIGEQSEQPNSPWLGYLVIDPVQNQLSIVWLPTSSKVKVMGGYGEYQLQAVQGLLELDKKSQIFINSALSFGVGRSVDDVLSLPVAQSQTGQTITAPLTQSELETQLWSSMMLATNPQQKLELLRLWLSVKRLSTGQVHIVEAPDLESLPGLIARYDTTDQFSRCSLAVVNTVQVAGLATKVARVLDFSGWPVVRITDEQPTRPETMVYYQDADIEGSDCATLLPRLTQLLPSQPVGTVNSEITQQYRAKIVIVIGENDREVLQSL
jgi:hypothetical protein